MKIYFEKFGNGTSAAYLTPMKIYEVVGSLKDGAGAKIKDNEGDEIVVKLIDDHHTGSSWKIRPEEPKAPSAVDIVASLESERNALANSIDSVNELMDSLSVPKSETLVERVYWAVSKAARTVPAGATFRPVGEPVWHSVEMVTEAGEVVSLCSKPVE